jgi:uncharacterized protein (DUF2267 family)
MRYGTFMGIVEEVGGLPRPDAERAVRAVLRVLGRRISTGEAEDIAAFLPAELRLTLTDAPEPAQAFGLDAFVRRVAELEGVDEATAFEHARAVFVALGQAVAPGELRDMASQLSKEFEPLLRAADAGRGAAEGRDDVIARVARITGLDREQARRVTDAVLEALAVRVSSGEIHDLIAELPAELHPALERGERESRAATPMSADEFLGRGAERAGVSREEAERDARAVFAALRDVVSSEEFADLAAQLSPDYEPLLAAST